VDHKDRLIFITGVVGRAMGSGQFQSGDILQLAQNADAAFSALFPDEGPKPLQGLDVYRQPQQQQSFQTPQEAHQANRAVQAPYAKVEPNVPQGLAQRAFGHVKLPPFNVWSSDQTKWGPRPSPLGKKWKDCMWSEVHTLLLQGNQAAVEYLRWIIGQEVDDEKWRAATEKRQAKAEALLGMVGMGAQEAPQGGPGAEDTPF
jgi:hypothetical protein